MIAAHQRVADAKLLVMDADGSHTRRIASVPALEPDWR